MRLMHKKHAHTYSTVPALEQLGIPVSCKQIAIQFT